MADQRNLFHLISASVPALSLFSKVSYFNFTKLGVWWWLQFNEGLEGGSWSSIPENLASRTLIITILNPVFLSQKNTLISLLIGPFVLRRHCLALRFGRWNVFILVVTISRIPDRQAKKSHIPSCGAVNSQIRQDIYHFSDSHTIFDQIPDPEYTIPDPLKQKQNWVLFFTV